MRPSPRSSAVCSLVAAAAVAASLSVAAPASAGNHVLIDFEQDPNGSKAQPWASVDHPGVAFASNANLFVYVRGGTEKVLLATGSEHVEVTLRFAEPMQHVSLVFGNDHGDRLGPEDRARLSVSSGGAALGSAEVTPNGDPMVDQTIAFDASSASECFTEATYSLHHSAAPRMAALVNDATVAPCEFADEIALDIDIRPDDDENRVVPHAKGRISVALHSTDDLDATAVDPAGVTFGPDGATPVGKVRSIDVDGDGDDDAVFQFRIADTGIEAGHVEACLDLADPNPAGSGCDHVSTDTGRT